MVLKWCFSNDKHYTYLIDEQLPQTLNAITQAVRAITTKKGYRTIACYLDDDFLIIGSMYDKCLQALNILLQLAVVTIRISN